LGEIEAKDLQPEPNTTIHLMIQD